MLNGAYIHKKEDCEGKEFFRVLVYLNDWTNRERIFVDKKKALRYARFVNKICWAKVFGYPSIIWLKTVAGIDYDKRIQEIV